MKTMLRQARREPWIIALLAVTAVLPSAIVVPVAMLGFHAQWHQVAGGAYAAPLVFVFYFFYAFGDYWKPRRATTEATAATLDESAT